MHFNDCICQRVHNTGYSKRQNKHRLKTDKSYYTFKSRRKSVVFNDVLVSFEEKLLSMPLIYSIELSLSKIFNCLNL